MQQVQARCKEWLPNLVEPDNPVVVAFAQTRLQQAQDASSLHRTHKETREQIEQVHIPETSALHYMEAIQTLAKEEIGQLAEHMRQLRNIIEYKSLHHMPRANYPGQEQLSQALEETRRRQIAQSVRDDTSKPVEEDTEKRRALKTASYVDEEFLL